MRRDNEAASAALAVERLGGLGCSPSRLATVERYVRATAHIGAPPARDGATDGDLDLFLDFDLSILASPPDVYDAYSAAIRREYAIYSNEAYARGRASVLRNLLALPVLYRVPALARDWEPRARANLKRELDGLLP